MREIQRLPHTVIGTRVINIEINGLISTLMCGHDFDGVEIH